MVSAGNGHQTTAQSPLPEAQEGNANSLANILTSSLDMLRIDDPAVRKKAVEFVSRIAPATMSAFGKHITALKAIADACAVEGKIFSQSEACDFLTVAANGIEIKRAGTKTINDATFQIYVDIMENYSKEQESSKLHYPRVIVDTISALDRGVDTKGTAVGVYGIDRYYQARKKTAPSENPESSYSSIAIKEAPKAVEAPKYDDELVENLIQITGRSKKDLQKCLSVLNQVDMRKIAELSANYKRLQKYGKMSDGASFKKQAEKDLGRSLTDNQLQHALNSIRKSRIYIENVLDGKFVPHGTHGINHVKHNLEYGYQLMGLMEPRKRRNS